jgi:predicted metalloprotease
MGRSKRLGIWLTLLVAALAGCGPGSDGPGSTSATQPAPDLKFGALAHHTEDALETFWRPRFRTISPRAWSRPRLAFYTDGRHPGGSRCIPQDSPRWNGNSFYCDDDEEIYLDSDWLVGLGREFTNPDVATVIVHAHEFGHHLQFLAGSHFRLPIGKELQADCYAGVFLSATHAGEADAGIGPGDVANAMNTIRSIADTPFGDDRWFKPGAHGGPIERAEAVATGFLTEDPRFCRGYESTGPILRLDVGPYGFRLPPATTAERRPAGGYRLNVASYPELNLDVSARRGLLATPVTSLTILAPLYLSGSGFRPVGRAEDFGRVGPFGVANLRYERVTSDERSHGVLVLVTRRDGTGLVLDASATGPAPPADDADGWRLLGNYAFSALWGVTG